MALNDALRDFIMAACQQKPGNGQGGGPGQQQQPPAPMSSPMLDIAGMVAAALSNAIQEFGSDSGNNGGAGNPIILPIFIRT